MTYHTRLLLNLVPGAIALAFVAYVVMWAFEALDVVITALHQGVTP